MAGAVAICLAVGAMPKRTKSTRHLRAKRKPPQRRRRPPRTAAVEATLAALAHDIRTPLTGILALSELLATSGLGEREHGWATAIKGTAEHLAMLTSLIVDASRAEAKGLTLRRTAFRPRQLAEALSASLTARAGAKDLASEVHVAADLPDIVIGDPLRLRSALENLIDNAVKFTDRGSVRLDVLAERRGRVAHDAGELVEHVADGLQARPHDGVLQFGRDRVEPLVGLAQGLHVPLADGRPQLVAAEDELADEVHQRLEQAHVDAQRLFGAGG